MRLIDADELKKFAIPCDIKNGALTDLCVPLYQIDYAPTVESKTEGEWIPIYPLTDKCSICNGEALDFNEYPYRSKYCPHCGAKMKGGEAVAANDSDN